MSEIVLTGDNGKLEVAWSYDGDYLVDVLASIDGFTGGSGGHCESVEFVKFAREFVEISEKLHGSTSLRSVLSDQFEIKIGPSNSRGHYYVAGHLSSIPMNDDRNEQKLKFWLEVEATELSKAARKFSEVAT